MNTLGDGKQTTMNHRYRREDDPHVQLAVAVLTRGYRDLLDKRANVKASALRFFGTGLCELWADAVRVDHDVVREASVNVQANGMPAESDRRRERYRRARGT